MYRLPGHTDPIDLAERVHAHREGLICAREDAIDRRAAEHIQDAENGRHDLELIEYAFQHDLEHRLFRALRKSALAGHEPARTAYYDLMDRWARERVEDEDREQ
ncbi:MULTISPECIES: hypothetical protein [Halorhodospira]|uniref:hypothetical protein n=1 Tax=Halorhodospira TaxID=85108 RepID=UPI001911DDCD|nr:MULTISPECIES: hypothetical protein [Halorhodospira]MBK5943349.1 hypothetical protein [Halorhodospira halophila]MCG5526874.1 hypothetical protein [Halorhodospira halophila]MCG5542789.1 hypothetical protein [Halorhodospira sp. 9628]